MLWKKIHQDSTQICSQNYFFLNGKYTEENISLFMEVKMMQYHPLQIGQSNYPIYIGLSPTIVSNYLALP